jgi:hypothetical protein
MARPRAAVKPCWRVDVHGGIGKRVPKQEPLAAGSTRDDFDDTPWQWGVKSPDGGRAT